ncbi:protein SCO1/2 [Mucilaginibacter gracilis]|uniref:Protein SCO1/2 n=1 Tax=Mucilaginibacter gracilis TaxID=423350 RepID=A0A495J9B8_9SPHI|nr:SCO family protein [Mucilaginibacter gracilis]RKR85605.1 protein SCO1/2 [Mucilaginibacter gracilis]
MGNNKVILLILLLTALACTPKKPADVKLPYFNTPDFTPIWLDKSTAEYQNLHTIPAFSFTDQNGNSITNQTVNNKIYVVDFFFTRCQNICPKMTGNMAKVSAAFIGHPNILMLSHSVTPELDNIAVLRNYAKLKNVTNPNWHLLTGDKKQIYDIARKGYFADNAIGYNKDFNEFLHTENFILVDGQHHIRGVYNGTIDFEIDNLIRHIKILEKEVD